MSSSFFFFNDTATTEIYTLSLHDALPISVARGAQRPELVRARVGRREGRRGVDDERVEPGGLGRGVLVGVDVERADRKSTRLNSSHANISYAVFCLTKTNKLVTIAENYTR